MTEKHRIPMSISVPCCGYCDKFHNGYKLLPDRERVCAKGQTVWMLSCFCGVYHQQTTYNCPHEGGKEVSSIQCINNRMQGFPHCLGCEVFLGEKGEARIKPKKIIKRQVILKKKIQAYHEPEPIKKKPLTIQDIAKGRG